MRLTVLGSGTSHGIPVIGCSCKVCASSDPRDKRFRSSLYVQGKNGERVVIDTGPEFRLQALRAGITRLNAVLLTHSHADHMHGIDDLRPLCYEQYLPVYGNESAIAELRERFSYVFKKTPYGGKPRLNTVIVSAPLQIGNLTFTPVPAKHGTLEVLGWLISESVNEQFASYALYLTDTSELPDASRNLIRSTTNSAGNGATNGAISGANSGTGSGATNGANSGTGSGAINGASNNAISVCIIGSLRLRPHPTHFSFEQAITASLEIGADQIYLTHICHELSHSEIEAYCQQRGRHIGPAWDMLEVEV
jgi:phosphoribosyl 1,2-cyclic phosphate phosphodiesterase